MGLFSQSTFTVGANTVLTSYTGEIGGTWTKNGGVGAVTAPNVVASTDRVRCNSTTEWIGYVSGTSLNADYDVQATVNWGSKNGWMGVTGRQNTGAQTYYSAFIDSAGSGGEGFYLGKVVSTTFTELAAYATTVTAGDIMVLRMRGSMIQLIVNGVVRGSVTDTSITAAGRAGLYGATYAAPGASVGWNLDDFLAYDPLVYSPPVPGITKPLLAM